MLNKFVLRHAMALHAVQTASYMVYNEQ